MLARRTDTCGPTRMVKKPMQAKASSNQIHTGNERKRKDKNKSMMVILKPLTATICVSPALLKCALVSLDRLALSPMSIHSRSFALSPGYICSILVSMASFIFRTKSVNGDDGSIPIFSGKDTEVVA